MIYCGVYIVNIGMVYYEMIVKSLVYSVRNCILMLCCRCSALGDESEVSPRPGRFHMETKCITCQSSDFLAPYNITARLTALDPPRASHHE